MKFPWPLVAAILAITILPAHLQADQRYTIQDLQALEKRNAWPELFMHLEDVPPSKRDATWDQVVIHACLQEDFQEDYAENWCGAQLKLLVNTTPNHPDLAWKSGKWARKHRAHWFAVYFFDKAITKSGDPRCLDEDVGLAIVSALGLPVESNEEVVRKGRELAFDKCWQALQPMLKRELADAGAYFRENVCEGLKGKKALSAPEAERCSGVR
jgi:hypothetical protein